MSQWLKILAALVEDPGSVPRTHLTVYNCLQLQFQRSQYLLLAPQAPSMYTVHITHADKVHILIR